jgi:hypothetical protein
VQLKPVIRLAYVSEARHGEDLVMWDANAAQRSMPVLKKEKGIPVVRKNRGTS